MGWKRGERHQHGIPKESKGQCNGNQGQGFHCVHLQCSICVLLQKAKCKTLSMGTCFLFSLLCHLFTFNITSSLYHLYIFLIKPSTIPLHKISLFKKFPSSYFFFYYYYYYLKGLHTIVDDATSCLFLSPTPQSFVTHFLAYSLLLAQLESYININ